MESSIAIEKTKTLALSEEEISYFLLQFRNYDILNIAHRKALINMLINKIYLYDAPDGREKNYKITIVFNAGKETVEITEDLYRDISDNVNAENICISHDSGHQYGNRLTVVFMRVKRFFHANF